MPSYEKTDMHSHRHPFLGESEGERVQEGDQKLFDYYGVEHGSGVFDDRNSIFTEEPFGGEYVPLLDADPEVQAAKVYLDGADKSADTTVSKSDPVKLVTPLVTGLLRAAVSYGILRTFDVNKKTSKKVAITLGVLELVGVLTGNWLRDKVADLPKAPVTTTAPPKPTGK